MMTLDGVENLLLWSMHDIVQRRAGAPLPFLRTSLHGPLRATCGVVMQVVRKHEVQAPACFIDDLLLDGCRCDDWGIACLSSLLLPSAPSKGVMLTSLHLSHEAPSSATISKLGIALMWKGPLKKLTLSHISTLTDGPLRGLCSSLQFKGSGVG